MKSYDRIINVNGTGYKKVKERGRYNMKKFYVTLNSDDLENTSGGCSGFWDCVLRGVGYKVQYWAVTTGRSNAEQAREDNGFGWP